MVLLSIFVKENEKIRTNIQAKASFAYVVITSSDIGCIKGDIINKLLGYEKLQ